MRLSVPDNTWRQQRQEFQLRDLTNQHNQTQRHLHDQSRQFHEQQPRRQMDRQMLDNLGYDSMTRDLLRWQRKPDDWHRLDLDRQRTLNELRRHIR